MKQILQQGERETSFIVHDPETQKPEISVESDRVALAARRLYRDGLVPSSGRSSP